MVVLRTDGASYWIVNTLLDRLSNETMIAIAKSLRPLATLSPAELSRGQAISARRYRCVAASQPPTATTTSATTETDERPAGEVEVDVGEPGEHGARVGPDGEPRRALARAGDSVLPHEQVRDPPPERPAEPEPDRDEQAGVGEGRERAGGRDVERELGRPRDERRDDQRDDDQRQDDRRGREHARRGQLPPRDRLQPEVDEQAVVDEIADARGREPEDAERDGDGDPVAARRSRRSR